MRKELILLLVFIPIAFVLSLFFVENIDEDIFGGNVFFREKADSDLTDNKEKYSNILPNNINNQNKDISFLFSGDIMMDRHVLNLIEKNGVEYLLDDLGNSFDFTVFDLISANLEGAVTNGGEHYKPENLYDFAFDPEHIEKLKKYNFNFFNIANNHLADQGLKGIEETRKNLDALAFNYSGCSDSLIDDCTTKIIEIKNKKIAMLGFSAVYKSLDLDKLKKEIEVARENSDLLIVNIHWGTEYQRKYNKTQQNLAHLIIDSGADAIIGHHPHVIQGIEIYKNKPIFYSLGNFIFDQYFSSDTQNGLMIELKFNEKLFIKIHPIKSINCKIFLMNNSEVENLMNEIIGTSDLETDHREQIKRGEFVLTR